MDAFYGTWRVQLDKTTGVADLGKYFGWNAEKVGWFSALQYSLLVEPYSGGNRCVIDYGFCKLGFHFTLGEPFDYTRVDKVKAKCTAVLEGNKLVEKYKTDDGVAWTTVRTVNGHTMTAITHCDNEDEKCTQELIKI